MNRILLIAAHDLYLIVTTYDHAKRQNESIVYQLVDGRWRDLICLVEPETAIEYVMYVLQGRRPERGMPMKKAV